MNNPEIYILKHNRFKGFLVDIFTDAKKAVIYKGPNRIPNFDSITKLISTSFLKVFLHKEDKEVCCMLFETKKENQFVENMSFPSILKKPTMR